MSATGTVMVAMSGGVDSSVAAALLQERGHRVVGATMLLWPEEVPGSDERCCGTSHLEDARAVCGRLGVRHYTFDLRREFRSEVVQPFLDSYRRGRTPNPCILCNQSLKFDHLLRKAVAAGADRLATGHYARILGDGPHRLARGLDPFRDQSYFLFPLGQAALGRLLFPLGELSKTEVRSIARRLGLRVSEKPDSQEICFVPPRGLGGFLRSGIPSWPGPGPVVDVQGRRLGQHEGACLYTVGQRRGLGVAAGHPLYVVRVDARANTVVVGTRAEASRRSLEARGASWVPGGPPGDRFRASVQIRHRHRPAPAEVQASAEGFEVLFDEPQTGVAPGQAAVLYDGETVVGGGWIVEGREGVAGEGP